MPEETLIGPVEVTRDEDGYWYHPGVPDFDEDVEAYKVWLAVQGLEVTGWHMESALESHPYSGKTTQPIALAGNLPPPSGTDCFLLGSSTRTTAHMCNGHDVSLPQHEDQLALDSHRHAVPEPAQVRLLH